MSDALYSVTEVSQNIVVIGAGINGLVTPNYLMRAGHQVTLLGCGDRLNFWGQSKNSEYLA